MNFEQIEKIYEKLWLFVIINHREFISNLQIDIYSDDIKSLSLQQQVILKEIGFFILSEAGNIEKSNEIKADLKRKEYIESNDKLINFFLTGIEIWDEYFVINNLNFDKLFKKQKEVNLLVDEIKTIYANDKSKLKYVIPYYAIFGVILRKYSYFDEAYALLYQGFYYSMEIENPLYIVISFFNLIIDMALDIDSFETFSKICQKKLDSLNFSTHSAYLSSLMGYYFLKKGKINQAINLFNESNLNYTNLEQENLVLSGIMNNYNFLGKAYILIGNIEQSLMAFNKALGFYRSTNEIKSPSLLANLGEVYNYKGDYSLALKFHLEALEIRKMRDFSSSDQVPLAESLYQLFYLYIQSNIPEEANKYYLMLKELNTEWENNEILGLYNLATIYYLKENFSFKNFSTAQNLLNEIIKKSINFEFTTIALINLIDLTLLEYKFFHNEEIFIRFKGLIEELKDYSLENNSILLSIKVNILLGKLEIIQGNLKQAENVFLETKNLAEKFDLMNLIDEIESQIEIMDKEVVKARDLLNSNVSVVKKIEDFEIEKYVTNIRELLILFKDQS